MSNTVRAWILVRWIIWYQGNFPYSLKKTGRMHSKCRNLRRKWVYYETNSNDFVNMKAIFAVMNATWAIVEIRPEKKFRPVGDLNPWPLRYQCSALPTELTSQLGPDYYVAIHAFPIEKTYDSLQFTINIVRGCNCANISHISV